MARTAAILLTLWLFAALVSCSSSSPTSPAPDSRVNQHLAYQPLPGDGATIKPHQTAVLSLTPKQNGLRGNAPGTGYHEIPYEISSQGNYKYCIPDDDSHVTAVELYNPSGALAAAWKKGGPCTYVPILPGKYTMRVHLALGESNPLIFLKPHNVEVTQKETMSALKGGVHAVLSSQLLNLKVDSLDKILSGNASKGLNEGWGITTSPPSAFGLANPYPNLKELSFSTIKPGIPVYYLLADAVTTVSKLDAADLFSMKPVGKEGDFVYLSQGAIPVGRFSTFVFAGDSNGGDALGLLSSLSPNLGLHFLPSGMSFKLSHDGKRVVSWARDNKSSAWAWAFPVMDVSWQNPVVLNVQVRYGITSGTNYPSLMAGEVALFDGILGTSGFPDGTHYWIISGDMQDFSDFSFSNPTNLIRTVIAGRGARAQVFENPSFHGSSFYVSPPMDSEMAMTATDTALLDKATVGSIRIEKNTNTIPVNEYSRHIIVSANTCIDCDLRGFDATSFGISENGLYALLKGGDFTDSDFSAANFHYDSFWSGVRQYRVFSHTNFTNVRFVGADLTGNAFYSTILKGTDFSKAVLTNARLNNYNNVPENAFYNNCPTFDGTDLTSLSPESDFGSFFPVAIYAAAAWWNKQPGPCRTSLAGARVSPSLFADKKLWQFVDAPAVDFSNMNLDGADFAGSNLRGAIFKNASLKEAIFVKADLTGVDFSGADLTGAHIEGAILTGVDLSLVKTLSKAYLSGAVLSSPNLSGLDMSGAHLEEAGYTNWDGHVFGTFDPARINGAYMYNTKLNGANLSGASLQNVSWYGAEATGENAIMVGAHFDHADLPGLNLKQTHLQGADFTDAVLINADLSTSDSPEYSFLDTNFNQANLKGANLSGANLQKANLWNAFIYAGATQQTATIEVLSSPHQYRFFQQAYEATKPAASTDGIAYCPNGERQPPRNDCGELTSASTYWLSSASPQEPTDCTLRPANAGEIPDDHGMVLDCTSKRHPR